MLVSLGETGSRGALVARGAPAKLDTQSVSRGKPGAPGQPRAPSKNEQ